MDKEYLKKEFDQAIDVWTKYCGRHINAVDQQLTGEIKRCSSYPRICDMKEGVLPLISDLYQRESPDMGNPLRLVFDHGLPAVVMEIAGDALKIPDNIKGDISRVRRHIEIWLLKSNNITFKTSSLL